MILFFICISVGALGETEVSIDKSLELKTVRDVDHTVFEDIVAVQRKSRIKKGKKLFNTYFSADFSDSAFTMYSTNFSLGYAFSENWEVYFTYAPAFITSERRISKLVKNLKLENGYTASIETPKAKSFMGIEINWVPIYGKDSFGEYGIIRSDTFVNFAAGLINYQNDSGSSASGGNTTNFDSGTKTKLMLGKTFFLSEYLNLRMMAGGAFIETLIANKKEVLTIGLLEAGLVFYF